MGTNPNVITGASGLLGGYIAERLARAGKPVRALIRETSERRFLESLGVEIVAGDLSNRDFAERGIQGAERVYHCAARTGNWGSWLEFQTGTVDTTRCVVGACRSQGVSRLLHVSSVACYGHPDSRLGEVGEGSPLGQNPWLWDYYNRAKIEAEEIVRELGDRATIVRPTWIYGPRDTATIPRILRTIRNGGYWMIGKGDNSLNMGYADDIAEGCILAATHPKGAGRVYNLCGEGSITQRELVDTLSKALGREPVRRRLPRQVLHWAAFALEVAGRITGRQKPPFISRHALSVFSRPAMFSSARIKAELGWSPKVAPHEGIAVTLDWIRRSEEGTRAAGGPLPGQDDPPTNKEVDRGDC